MDEAQLAAALADIREQETAETRRLEGRVEQYRRAIERHEGRLQEIRATYDRRYRDLIEEFRGRKPSAPSKVETVSPSRSGEGRRIRRGSLDGLLLKFFQQWSDTHTDDPTLTVSRVSEEWNRLHPEMKIGRATLRGVMDRLTAQETPQLFLVEAGGKGNANPRQYIFLGGSEDAEKTG